MKTSNCIAILAVAAILLSGCSKSTKDQSSPTDIVQANIGGRDFYIPKAYLDRPYTSVGPTSALLQAWYPGDQVVPGKPDQLWREKQWYMNVRILIDWVPEPAMQRVLASQIRLQKATNRVGIEYGLIHQTQLRPEKSDHDDLWIDTNTNDVQMFVACSHLQNTAKIHSVPQCKHYMHIGHFLIEINYNRRLLPHWNEIQGHVTDLFNSFQSKETASAYLNDLITSQNHEGDQP